MDKIVEIHVTKLLTQNSRSVTGLRYFLG